MEKVTKNNQEEETIKVISQQYIKPIHLTQEQNPYYLNPLECGMLSIDPIQKGLLFSFSSLNSKPNISSFVHKLKLSLSHALVHFYPLAGRFQTQKYPDEKSCWVFLDCTIGDGARLIHAVDFSLSVGDIISNARDVPLGVRSFFDIGQRYVNHDGHVLPLLTVQVTEIFDGVFVGFSMNHSLVDGTSFSHFLTSLSEIFTSLDRTIDSSFILSDLDVGNLDNVIPISKQPLFGSVFLDGYEPVVKLPYLEPEEFVTRYDPGPLRERIFHFSSSSMATLKAKANQDCEVDSSKNDGAHQTISSFQALAGLVWRSITRARNPALDQRTTCNLLINARPRVEPPLCSDNFGNFISLVNGICTVEELLGRSLGWAAMHLHKKIVESDNKAIQRIWKMIADRPMVGQPGLGQQEMYGPNTVVIGGSPRFDMYGPEFGLGRAVGVRNGYGNKDDGKVTANPGCEGGGSVDLEICLKSETMARLQVDEEFMCFVS